MSEFVNNSVLGVYRQLGIFFCTRFVLHLSFYLRLHFFFFEEMSSEEECDAYCFKLNYRGTPLIQ